MPAPHSKITSTGKPTATLPSQHAHRNVPQHRALTPSINFSKHVIPRSRGLRTASSTFPRMANRSSPLHDSFTCGQHLDLCADFVVALPSAAARSHSRSHPADRPNGRINPPVNIKEWWNGKMEGDSRWKYDTPPQGNTNIACVQHILHHLAPNGSEAVILSAKLA